MYFQRLRVISNVEGFLCCAKVFPSVHVLSYQLYGISVSIQAIQVVFLTIFSSDLACVPGLGGVELL